MYAPWFQLSLQILAAQQAAAGVVMHRVGLMVTAGAAGAAMPDPELVRMVAEKWIAATEGALAVPAALTAMNRGIAAGPAAASAAAAGAAAAIMRPAMRRVHANARRLRRKRYK